MRLCSIKSTPHISDGGGRGNITGTGRLAGILGLNNLIMFYDPKRHPALYRVRGVVMNEEYQSQIQGMGLKRNED